MRTERAFSVRVFILHKTFRKDTQCYFFETTRDMIMYTTFLLC